MADLDKLAVDKLGVDNYATWSIKMKHLLIHKGLWRPVNTGEGGAASDEKALALIMLFVADYHLSTLAECESAKEAWDKLAAIHKSKSIARRTLLRKELTSLEMSGVESLTQYVARAKNIRDQLIAAGYDVREDEVVLAVLAGLPKEYEMVVTVLESADEVLSLDEVLPKLMNVEQRTIATKPMEVGMRAFIAKGNTRTNDKKECWYCGKIGHVKANCFKKAEDERHNTRRTPAALTAVAL